MGRLAVCAGVLAQLVFVLLVTGAAAEPASGPHETVDQQFTTTQPGAPTGSTFTGVYHAAGNPDGNPPYMRRMTFYPPAGMRIDTSVPDRCTAPDVALQAFGPDACPIGSQLGSGTTEGLFYAPLTNNAFVMDHYQHTMNLLNNTNEQILLVRAEGYAVVRGKIQPDGSQVWESPTCFPEVTPGECADDYILQLRSASFVPAYTRIVDGQVRSYLTTPPTCPSSGAWETTIRFWWSDGTEESVVTRQPC